MKKDKVIQNLRSIRVVLTLVFAFFIASTAWADSWPEYITDLKVIGGPESLVEDLTSSLRSKGWIRIEQDLNEGAGGDYVYLFYKKGSRNDPNGGYITDLTIQTSNDNSFKKNGRIYHRVDHDGNDHFKKFGGNLNSGTKQSSTNMWLYYTKQNFSDKRAVSSIYFNSSSSGAVGEIDLNKGAGGAYIYMHYSTVTKTNRPKTDLKIASDFRYDGNNHKLLVEVPTLFEGSNIKYWYTYESETSTRRSLFSSLADFYVSGAGMHTVEYYVEGNSYADQSSTYSQTVIVSKSSNNNLSVNIGSSYMQGEEFFPSLAGKNLSTGSFRYEYSTSGSSAYTSTKPSAPGSYWVRAVIEGDKNCYRYTTRSSGFRINALMAYATIEPIPAQVYTGSAICPEVTVKHGEKILKQDSDYFVSCSNNIDVGTATMTITGMGEFIGDPFQLGTYYGSTTRQFTISQKPVNGFDLVYEENPTYTGSAVCPEITVKDGEKTLVQGTDYTVACNEIVNVGEKGYITVTGIGDYIGEVSGPVNLLPKSMDSQDISTTITWTYKNSMYVPTIAVKDGDRTLVENTDYSIETLNEDFYVTATINGIGNYVNSIGVAPVIVSGTQNDISVPDGALVVFSNAAIEGSLTCDGSATIVLVGENSLTASDNGIQGGKSGSTLTIRGDGSLTIDAKRGISYEGNVNIIGGKIEATGSEYGVYANGDIKLDWTNDTDYIKVSSYRGLNLDVPYNRNFVDEKGNVYSDHLNGSVDDIADKMLRGCYVLTFSTGFSEIAVESQVLLPGQVPTKPADPVLPNRNFLGWKNILDDNDFDWTKPIIENTTVYARWEMIPVEYVDKNGDVQTLTKEYTVLTETNYPEYTYIYYGSVWLVAKGEVTRPCLDFSGSVNLILTDGAKLTIDDTDCGMRALEINVYGQSEQTGSLTVKSSANYVINVSRKFSAVGGNLNVINTGNGKSIKATSGIDVYRGSFSVAADIDCGELGVHGGTVDVDGLIHVSLYDVTLNWTNDTDYIKANGYKIDNGSIKVGENKVFKDEKGNKYFDNLSSDEITAVAGQKLSPFRAFALSFVTGNENVSVETQYVEYGQIPTVPVDPVISDYVFLGWFADKQYKIPFDWTKPLASNTLAYARWEKPKGPVKYLDENGEEKVIAEYEILIVDDMADILSLKNGGWFVVQGEISFDGAKAYDQVAYAYQYSVMPAENAMVEIAAPLPRSTHLILTDGAKLSISNIGYSMRFDNLVVYAQSTGNDKGRIDIEGADLLINVYNDFVINGGTVNLKSSVYANSLTVNGGDLIVSASNGISSGDITINGGSVDASAIDGSAIEAYGVMNVNGGAVTAYSENGYGISLVASIAKFNNGTVTANGYKAGIGIEPTCSSSMAMGIEFAGATVTSNSYYSAYTEAVFRTKGVAYTDGDGNIFYGDIFSVNDEQYIDRLGEIAGKTIRPIEDPIIIVTDADGKKRAYINGVYAGQQPVNISSDIKVDAVTFIRDFPKEKYSTTVLPFDVNTENVEGLDAVLRYNGIKTVNGVSSIRMKVVWATDKWVETNDIRDEKNNLVHYNHADLTANTPYLVLMNDASFKLKSGAFPLTLKETVPAEVSIDGWTFRGTWKYKKWGPSCSTKEQNCDPETGFAYGFAASSSDDNNISVGDFVKVGEGAWIRPMRAYLVKKDKMQAVRANGAYVKRPSFAQEELPEFMSIVIDNGDGDDENAEHTTVIGQFNTRTGEIKMNYDRGKFDLKGRRVNGKNNARGAYYGKKVLKK